MKRLLALSLVFMVALVADPTEEVSIVDITYFFRLTDEAVAKVLEKSGVKSDSSSIEIEKALKNYMIKEGVVFSKYSSFRFYGNEIELKESEENAKLVEKICRDLGLDESYLDEWRFFQKIEIEYSSESEALRFVKLHWEKEMDDSLIKVIVMKTPQFHKDDILYQGYTRVYESDTSDDPFVVTKTKEYICWLEVDSRSLDRVYIGTRRPYSDLRSLKQLKEFHNQAGDDNSVTASPPLRASP